MMLPLFGMLLAAAFFNRYAEPPAAPVQGDEAGFRARMRRPETIAFFVAAFLVQVSFGPYYTFFSIYLGEHGYSPSMQGVLWSIGVLVEIGVLFLSQRIFRRWGARRLLVFSLGITVLRWWATAAWPDSLPVMVVAQATHAFSFAAFFAAAMLLLAEYFPGRHNGHGQGVFYGLSSGVGGVIGALLAGQVWHYAGGQAAFALAGFIALSSCAVAWRWLLRPRVAVGARA
jgi:PPP family 3-phenylpropionic acid transporter